MAVPDCNKLPTLKEDKFMLEFYNAIPEKQMIALYARQVNLSFQKIQKRMIYLQRLKV